jgi:hypothetical protein
MITEIAGDTFNCGQQSFRAQQIGVTNCGSRLLIGGSHSWKPGPNCRIDEADHSRKAMLTSTNVTTTITRTPIPSAAICGVMADKKSMTAKPTCQDCLRNSPRLRARSDFRWRFYNAGSVSSQGFAWEDCYDWQRR